MSHLLVCPHKIYVVSRLSRGWEDCGGSCTLFGSMLGVYMLESTSSSGPGPCLAKLQRMSMNHEERLTCRGTRRMTRSSLNSHPGLNVIYILFADLTFLNSGCLVERAKQFQCMIFVFLIWFNVVNGLTGKRKAIFMFSSFHTLSLTEAVHLSYCCSETRLFHLRPPVSTLTAHCSA